MRRQRLAIRLFCSSSVVIRPLAESIFFHFFNSNAMKRPLLLASTLTVMFIVFCGATSATFAQKKLPKPNMKGFDEFVMAQLKEWDVPGCAVAIVKDGEVMLAKGYGLRDVAGKKPMTAQTLLGIGSCSKAFTATDVAMLVDEGKLAWDKPVREYLPSFKLSDEYAASHVTLRDMLSHRTGLPRHDYAWYGAPDTMPSSRKGFVEKIGQFKFSKELREQWQYNNFMFTTAGYVVETSTGRTWEQFTKARIFEPLEMKTATFSVVDMQKTSDYALPYGKKKVSSKEMVQLLPFRNIDPMGPAGSINACVQEMANWVTAQLAKGKFKNKQVLPAAQVAELQKPLVVVSGTMDFDESSYITYGLGWFQNVYRGHLRVYHGGNIDGFSATTQLLPRDSIGVVVLVNMDSSPLPSIIASNALDRLLGLDEVNWSKRTKEREAKAKADAENKQQESEKARAKGTKPSHPLKDYTGEYEHLAYGVWSIKQAGDSLQASFHGLSTPLKHYHYDVFAVADEDNFPPMKLTFAIDERGDIAKLLAPMEPTLAGEMMPFERVAEKKAFTKEALERFAGEYSLAGMVVTVAVRADNTLTVTVPGQPTYELVFVKDARFNLKGLNGYSLEFTLPTADTAAKATEATFFQPNGTFTAKRK